MARILRPRETTGAKESWHVWIALRKGDARSNSTCSESVLEPRYRGGVLIGIYRVVVLKSLTSLPTLFLAFRREAWVVDQMAVFVYFC